MKENKKRLLFGFPIEIDKNKYNTLKKKKLFTEQWIEKNNLNLKSIENKDTIIVKCDNPRSIDIELTNICNAKCIFCPNSLMSKQGYLKEKFFFSTIKKVRKANIGKIMFIGRGEALLHPQILNFIEYIKTYSGTEVEIFTNGYNLSKNLIDKLIVLNDKYINLRINVSLHSLKPEIHHKLLGFPLSKIAENIKYLMKQEGKIAYCISFVKNKINEEEMINLRKYSNKFKINNMDISLIYNKGGLIKNKNLFDMKFYKKNLTEAQINEWQLNSLCHYTYTYHTYYVNYRGEFMLCHSDYEDKLKIGDIFQNSFTDIDKKVNDFKKKGGSNYCKACNKRLRELYHGEDIGEAQVRNKIII